MGILGDLLILRSNNNDGNNSALCRTSSGIPSRFSLWSSLIFETWVEYSVDVLGVLMNEARLSHLPFWGPSEGFFLLNSTAVGFTRVKRSSFGLRVRVNPWVNLGERFIRVNPTDVKFRTKPPHWDPKRQVA